MTGPRSTFNATASGEGTLQKFYASNTNATGDLIFDFGVDNATDFADLAQKMFILKRHGTEVVALYRSGALSLAAGLTVAGTTVVQGLTAGGATSLQALTVAGAAAFSGATTVGGSAVATAASTTTFTGKTIDADLNTITNIENADIKAAAGISLNKLAALAANIVPISDASGFLVASGTTATELSYLAGATSSIQNQLNAKASASSLSTHTGASTGVHGISGAVVGTTDTQTLTNKTLTAPAISSPTGLVKADVGLGNVDNTSDATKNAAAVTLTNKTLTAPVQSSFEDFTAIASPANPGAGLLRVYAKSDNRLYTKDSAGIETQVGSGSGGGINFISNQNFENGAVTGWATYADAAATTPVDGTGGSPSVTFAAQTGSNTRGTYSGRLTKGATNRQGDGVAYAFTIDPQDKGKPLVVSFDSLASANFAAGDVTVYIYDVTNSVLITPASVTVAAGTFSFNAFFVASTSVSYRLILHVASTNASAWTLDTDNFNVGPGVPRVAPPVTDPILFTPSTTGGFGTITGSALYFSQSAAFMIVRGRFTTGTVAASAARIGLPSGYVVGSQLGSSITLVGGTWWRNNASATTRKTGTIIYSAGDSFVSFSSADYTTASAPATSLNADTISSSGEIIWVDFVIPISTFSSSVQAADRVLEEFASNSSSTDAADTSSFVYGAAGSTGILGVTSLTSDRLKRVRFQSPIQPTDVLTLEVQASSTAAWQPIGLVQYANGLQALQYQNGVAYGIGLIASVVNSTDIDVVFGRYAYASGATYGAAGTNFNGAGFVGYKWRVRKVSAGAQIGGAISTANIVGRNDGSTPGTGYIGQKFDGVITATAGNASNTAVNAGKITALPTGTWLVFGKAYIFSAVANALVSARASISTTSATGNATNLVGNTQGITASEWFISPTPLYVVVPAGSTQDVYLVASAITSSGTYATDNSSSGILYAVRIA